MDVGTVNVRPKWYPLWGTTKVWKPYLFRGGERGWLHDWKNHMREAHFYISHMQERECKICKRVCPSRDLIVDCMGMLLCNACDDRDRAMTVEKFGPGYDGVCCGRKITMHEYLTRFDSTVPRWAPAHKTAKFLF